MVWPMGSWLVRHPHFRGLGVEEAGGLDTVDTEGKGHSRSLKPRAPLSVLDKTLSVLFYVQKG